MDPGTKLEEDEGESSPNEDELPLREVNLTVLTTRVTGLQQRESYATLRRLKDWD